ncbi:MAG: hypothetical protein R3F17_11100 [Planctomycetota bacterium]
MRFFFDGIDPLTGAVLRSGGGTGSSVAPLADVIAATTLQSVGTAPFRRRRPLLRRSTVPG